MWREKHINFLTKIGVDENQLLNMLIDYKKNISGDDSEVLQKIINDFKNENYSLLTTQEIQFLKNNPSNVWPQYLIFREKFLFHENNLSLSNFPLYLIIEPVSACNLRCPFCHQTDESFLKNTKMFGMMDMSLFKKIIDEAYENGTKAITLTGRGEPTIHPHIGEMLEYCSGKFFEIKLNTNATKLNDKLISQILKSGITDLVFSADSYYKEEYESLRVGAVFEEVLTNIKKFKEVRKLFPNSKCVTRISGVQASDKQNPQKFKEFWEQYVDYVVMVNMLHRWDLYSNATDMGATTPCHYLGRGLSIYFDGAVIPCDIDYQGILEVGTVKNDTIRNIWHGEKYGHIFNAHKNGKRSSCYPCDRCPIGT